MFKILYALILLLVVAILVTILYILVNSVIQELKSKGRRR